MRIITIPVHPSYEFINLDNSRVKSSIITGPEDKRELTIVMEASFGREYGEEYFKSYIIGEFVPYVPNYPEYINIRNGCKDIPMSLFVGTKKHLKSLNKKFLRISSRDTNKTCVILADIPQDEDFDDDMYRVMLETLYYTRTVYVSNNLTTGLISDGITLTTPSVAFNKFVELKTKAIFITKRHHVEVFISRLDAQLCDYKSIPILEGTLYVNIKGPIGKLSLQKLLNSISAKYKSYVKSIGDPREHKFSGLYLTNYEYIRSECKHRWLDVGSDGCIHLGSVPIAFKGTSRGELIKNTLLMLILLATVDGEHRTILYYGKFPRIEADVIRKDISSGNMQAYNKLPHAIDVSDSMALTLSTVTEDVNTIYNSYAELMLESE